MRSEPHHSNNSVTPARTGAGWRIARWALFLPVLAFACGCSSAKFYHQAVMGHIDVMRRQESIESILKHPTTSPQLASKLKLVLRLREFADQELGLTAGKQYLHYADLERPYVVWDIYAAEEFSLEPKTWWYPFVGRLSYRGYFREELAQRDAARLSDRGYDVFVGGIDAYSTLGWFHDPVLNTFINRDPADVADLIFHELAHQRLFIRGDTDFNEAFATAVARAGVRRWLRSHPTQNQAQAWEERTRRDDQFISLVLQARSELQALYSEWEKAPTPHRNERLEDWRGRKAAILRRLDERYARLKTAWGAINDYDAWFDYPVNNARLNAEATYYEWVPAFENLLAHQQGNLEEFYKSVEALGRLEPNERLAALQLWAPMELPSRSLVRSNP